MTENKVDSNAEKDTPENKCKCDTEKDQSLEDLLKDDDDDMFAGDLLFLQIVCYL